MTHKNRSLLEWLWATHWELITPLLLGYREFITDELMKEYEAWANSVHEEAEKRETKARK